MPDSQSNPLVTVGIPTYNRPAGLRNTLECITQQTYRHLEILIADNCSPNPETEAITREFAARDARIDYLRHPKNLGIDANFKSLLERAKGTYFFWAADDDEWTLDFIETCLNRISDSGSVMTGLRVAVRSRGLLRPKPPLQLSHEQVPFANAVAFFTNLQPSLFYGIHRTDTLRIYLREHMYDYYDCFFILRQILTNGFETDPKICFYIGVENEVETYKPARPKGKGIYEYWPFYSDSIRATLSSRKLSFLQKLRLGYLLTFFALNEFAYFERNARPRKAWLARVGMACLRPWRHVYCVPLPNPPPTMLMPKDPAEVPYMQIPAADLQDEAGIRKHLDVNLQHLRDKLYALTGIEAEAVRLSSSRWWIWRKIKSLAAGSTLRAPKVPEFPADTGDSLHSLRHRLGLVLLALEQGEARVQAMIRLVANHKRLNSWRDRFRIKNTATSAVSSLSEHRRAA